MQANTGENAESSDLSIDDFNERVRNLAYDLWQKEGQPEGREEEFWLRAEQRVVAAETTHVPLMETIPDDQHDATAAESFPASDPPSSTPVASTKTAPEAPARKRQKT